MNIVLEIKADKELLEVLVAIKNALTISKQTDTESESMTLEEFVAEPQKQVKKHTLEEVRSKLTELSRAGKRAAVNELIKSYGATKLTDLEEQYYADLMQKAGEM